MLATCRGRLLHWFSHVFSLEVAEPVGDAKGGLRTFPLEGGMQGSGQTGRDADGTGGNGPCNDCMSFSSPDVTGSEPHCLAKRDSASRKRPAAVPHRFETHGGGETSATGT